MATWYELCKKTGAPAGLQLLKCDAQITMAAYRAVDALRTIDEENL